MKCLNVGVVLSTVAVMGVIGAGCNKNTTNAEKKSVPVAKVEAKAVKAEPKVEQKKAPAWLAEFFGDKVVLADGSEVSTDTLAGKTIGIYFSAHWCPPCRGFTPQLVKAYNEMVDTGKSFDIVFVSSDHSKENMMNYMTETKMPWKGLPFGSSKKQSLAAKYGVHSIPTLVIVDKDGNTVSTNARIDVMTKGSAAFDGWKK